MRQPKYHPTPLTNIRASIEKYVNAIFAKLGLSEERKISRRVVAVLAYLRDLDRQG